MVRGQGVVLERGSVLSYVCNLQVSRVCGLPSACNKGEGVTALQMPNNPVPMLLQDALQVLI